MTSYLKDTITQAAVFNQTEIVFALMDHKASLDCKNSQGKRFQQVLQPI